MSTSKRRPLPGTTDQVDVNVSVTEKSTGSIMVGAGFSSSEGLVLSGSVSQANVFGSGNYLSAQINSGKVNTVYSLSYTNPYYTDRWHQPRLRHLPAQSQFILLVGFPIRFRFRWWRGALRRAGERNGYGQFRFVGRENQIDVYTILTASPQRYLDYVNEFGASNTTLRGDIGWARDTRDSIIYPTKGSLQRAFSRDRAARR